MREKQKLSIVCWATTGNVSPDRIPEIIDERNTKVVCIICWAPKGNVSPERIPERINERNTKVVCCL
jgi:hypothetical protein